MKSLIAAVFVLFSMPSFAGVITYDFTRLVLGDEADQTSLIGQITFDENETQFNMNTWLSFFFQLEFDGVTYDIFEQDIAFFEISDLNDGIYGNDENEGFELFITDTKFNELRTILSESKERGTHVYELNTKELGNGMYFLKLKTENQTLTKQIVIEN